MESDLWSIFHKTAPPRLERSDWTNVSFWLIADVFERNGEGSLVTQRGHKRRKLQTSIPIFLSRRPNELGARGLASYEKG